MGGKIAVRSVIMGLGTDLSEPAARPVRSARKARGDGHLRRAEILEAAERIFVAEGYERATIRRIAEEVGVSSTALYMHFRDKAEILLEISEATIRILLERNRDIAARPLDSVQRIRMMLEAYASWGFDHPNAYQLVYGQARDVPKAPVHQTADLAARCYEIFSGVVRETAREGRLKRGDADSAAQALWACVHGVVHLWTTHTEFGWVARGELLRVALDGVLDGVTSPAPRS